MTNGGLKILFVINPGSGGSDNTNWEPLIRDYFQALPHSIAFYFFCGTDDQSAVKVILRDMNPDRVVAVGGDGTISFVAQQILKTSIALGVIAAGSANGMARELDIPPIAKDALDLILNGQIKACDAIMVNNKHFCLHLSDIGLNAKLIKYFEEGKLRGKLGYASVLLKTLFRKTRMKVNIELKDKTSAHLAFMVVLANASKYGTGAVINPHGNLYDGLFEVVIVRRLALSELFKMLFRPQPFDPKKIQVFHARSVSIATSRSVHFQVDGEYLGKVKKVDAVILQGQLNVIVPG